MLKIKKNEGFGSTDYICQPRLKSVDCLVRNSVNTTTSAFTIANKSLEASMDSTGTHV